VPIFLNPGVRVPQKGGIRIHEYLYNVYVCVCGSMSRAQVNISRHHLEACGLVSSTHNWFDLAKQLATKVTQYTLRALLICSQSV